MSITIAVQWVLSDVEVSFFTFEDWEHVFCVSGNLRECSEEIMLQLGTDPT